MARGADLTLRMQFIVSHSQTQAQPAAIERLVIVNDQVAISAAWSTNPPRLENGSYTGGPLSPNESPPWTARLYGARNAVCKYGAVDRLSPRNGSSRWKFDEVPAH